MKRLASILPLFAVACGAAAQFEPAGPAAEALEPHAEVVVAASVEDLPKPAVVLGTLRLTPTRGPTPEPKARARFQAEARRHGCDAVADLLETNAPNQPGLVQWTATCVRTAKAGPPATPTTTTPGTQAVKPETCRQWLKCPAGKPCECSVQALVDLAAQKPEGPDAQAIWLALQFAVQAQPAATWLTVEAAKVSTEEEERGPSLEPGQIQAELERHQATAWKSMTPKDYTFRYTLRNPTRNQVVVDVLLPGGTRTSRLLTPGQTVPGSHTARCRPHGGVRMQKLGNVLEMHFDCDADTSARVVAVRPVKRELAVDRHAGDIEPPMDVVAKVWQAVPGTRMTDVYLRAIDAALGRQQRDLTQVHGRLQVFAQSGSGPVPAAVELRNAGPRATTVVFDVGPVRAASAVVPAGGEAEVKLSLPVDAEKVLTLKAALPALRSADWLVGRWTFGELQVVILPVSPGLAAFFITQLDDGAPRVVAAPVLWQGDTATFETKLPAAWARGLGGPDKASTVRIRVQLPAQTQFVLGGGRAMPSKVDVGAHIADVVWSADQ